MNPQHKGSLTRRLMSKKFPEGSWTDHTREDVDSTSL